MKNTVVGYNVEVLHHLKDVAKDYGLSLKSVFLGISLYVTSMLSYRRKITIGLVANNRPIVEDGDKLLGCFLNTIPFVFDMPEPGESWINYFKKIDEKLKQLEIHDRTPLAEIARINGESSPKENPFLMFCLILSISIFMTNSKKILSMYSSEKNRLPIQALELPILF